MTQRNYIFASFAAEIIILFINRFWLRRLHLLMIILSNNFGFVGTFTPRRYVYFVSFRLLMTVFLFLLFSSNKE